MSLPGSTCYTTGQEIAFLRHVDKYQPDLLPLLVAPYSRRCWEGAGMAVDGDAVREELHRLLGLRRGHRDVLGGGR